jgi:hypothetical protein
MPPECLANRLSHVKITQISPIGSLGWRLEFLASSRHGFSNMVDTRQKFWI